MLSACAKPNFEFRAYTDLSTCTDVIDAELAGGARYNGVYASEDPADPAQTVELSGTLFSQSVDIEVICTAGRVDTITYLSAASDPIETGAIFASFADELEALFGAPTVIVSEQTRSLRYLCHSHSPVLLEEWRLGPNQEADEAEIVEHEVYVSVVPSAAACIDTGR